MILFCDQFQKRLMLVLAGISFFCFIQACQQKQDQTYPNEEVKADTIKVSDLEVVISAESGILGRPSHIAALDEVNFAVYDQSFNKVMVFNAEGDKQFEFGRTGRGPGEWDPQMKAGDLNYSEGRFLLNNRGQYKLDLFDANGAYIQSTEYPQYWNYSHKSLLNSNQLLISSKGHEDALALISDLSEGGEILKKIGEPEAQPFERPNFEQQRVTLSNGEIPDEIKNDALAVKVKNGFVLLMNSLGELRFYSEEGELKFIRELPGVVVDPIFKAVVEGNKKSPQHTVFILRYGREFISKGSMIHILTPNLDLDDGKVNSQFLSYNLKGELQKHTVFTDEGKRSRLYDFIVEDNDQILLLDAINAQVLRYNSKSSY